MKIKSKPLFVQWMMLALIALCLGSCKDDDNDQERMPFDPSKEVVIKSFTPEKGGAYQQLLIYGENFGTDYKIVKVTVGGQDATVVSATGTNIYCYVPMKAFAGTIEVTIGDETNVRKATAAKKFEYKPEMMTSTLCGYRTTDDVNRWDTGPFETAYGFREQSHMNFDPVNKKHLYVAYDHYHYIQLIDLEKREVRNVLNAETLGGRGNRIRSVCFTKASAKYNKAEGQYMIFTVDADNSGDKTPNVFMVERNADGTFDDNSHIITLASFKQCNGAAVHPVNGEIYFNSYNLGQVFRLDPEDYWADPNGWNPNQVENKTKIEQLFTISDPSFEFKITFHPSGNYAYINVLNNNYILRSDYNSETKRLITPYNIAGIKTGGGAYEDGVGSAARFNKPYQGVFAKNEEITVGDPYEYYVTDFGNHCIRKINADGIVSTYAGRGTNGIAADNNQWGADDGALRTQTRFRDPSGMAYDPDNNVFYIHSTVGRTIRTISLDKPDEEETGGEEAGETNP